MIIETVIRPNGQSAWTIRFAGSTPFFTVLTTYMDARGYARAFSTLAQTAKKG